MPHAFLMPSPLQARTPKCCCNINVHLGFRAFKGRSVRNAWGMQVGYNAISSPPTPPRTSCNFALCNSPKPSLPTMDSPLHRCPRVWRTPPIASTVCPASTYLRLLTSPLCHPQASPALRSPSSSPPRPSPCFVKDIRYAGWVGLQEPV